MTIRVNDFWTVLGRKALVAQGIVDTFGDEGGRVLELHLPKALDGAASRTRSLRS
jgi:hypothetical protein